jgi:hypothetical protein
LIRESRENILDSDKEMDLLIGTTVNKCIHKCCLTRVDGGKLLTALTIQGEDESCKKN